MDISNDWKVHTPRLLEEIAKCCKGSDALIIPFNIFKGILAELAECAIRKDDPELNVLMLRLALYDVKPKDTQEAIDRERKRMRKAAKK